jgi:lantibiotic modifying enzyme
VLARIGAQGKYKVIESGDWHDGRCVLVLEESKGRSSRLLVIKPRYNEATLLLKSITDHVGFTGSFGVSIPFLKKDGEIWVQNYVQPEREKTLLSTQIGGLVAATLWAGLTDLHDENLIFNDSGVHLIDTECAFDFSTNWLTPDYLNSCGLVTGKRPGLSKVNVRDYSRSTIERAIKSAINTLLEGSPADLYEQMDSVYLRRVIIATRIYMTFLRQRFLFGWTDREMEARWRYLRSANPASESIVCSELFELKNWNVPLFYQRGRTILDAHNIVHDFCEPPSVVMQAVHKTLKDTNAVKSIALALCAALELNTAGMRPAE